MTTMTTSNLFPGMGCNATEFMLINDEVKFLNNGRILPFCELSSETLAVLEQAINDDVQVKIELHDWFPNSKMKRIEKFAKCRFGGLDFQADILNGKLQEGEYWECSLQWVPSTNSNKTYIKNYKCKPSKRLFVLPLS